MSRFTDTIAIRLKAGDGGAGGLSFRREKYVPKGGPDGGDGGKGGDVIIMADRRYYNLAHYFKDRIYRARRGGQGMGRNRHGADGENLTLPVPPGTQILNEDTGELLADLLDEGDSFCAARGGIGGKGNAFFKSATNRTPRMSQPGTPGEELYIRLSLKLIADIGLVGLPNAGKSTLLSVLTSARPKIGDYPFTTITPNLGVLQTDERVILIADIPGIIAGAHRGLGLGLSFLRHIERVKAILYLIDITEEKPAEVFAFLQEELGAYNEALPEKPCCVLLSKADTVSGEEMRSILDTVKLQAKTLPVSALNNYNMEELKRIILELAGQI